MKKFFILLKKELKEMLTPQLWVPFLAVIVVLFIVGNFASKQVKEQSKTQQSIVVFDADNSTLSKISLESVKQLADLKYASSGSDVEFVAEMKKSGVHTGFIIPAGFERDVLSSGKADIKTYAILNNFSVMAGKDLAVLDTATAAINESISNTLIGLRIGDANASELKNPILADKFVSSNGIIAKGNPTELLSYIMSQTTSVPVVLFVVIIMAAQMIAAAVATEKENKTLETLLSLPVSRKAIVSAKMLSAGLVSLFMAGIYMIGIKSFNSGMTNIFAGSSAGTGDGVEQIAETLGLKMTTLGFIELGVILFLAILLALAIAMILGAFSEDAKSAQGVVAPLMILVMIPYFVTLFTDINLFSAPIRYLIYAIPFSHIFIAIPNILLQNNQLLLAGAIYMLVLFVVFVLIAAKIFSSDLILTMKLNFSKKKIIH